MFQTLTAEAQKAIDEDGADVILLGSTTMHQAGDYMAANLPAATVAMARFRSAMGLTGFSYVRIPGASCPVDATYSS